MSALVDHLRAHGDRVAVLTATEQLSYAALADRVAGVAAVLGPARRLVLLETRNDVATLTAYLGALAARHVVLPVAAGTDHTAISNVYTPDVIIDAGGIRQVRNTSRHELHEDLALLMSTSGSTGSPKLVRLSWANLLANAESIATYLDIRPTDRAATTLPMSYCYGLSVVHSHLLRGAGLILTDASVVDDEFWELFGRHRGTTFAGVPYTFDLLDRIGFEAMDLPHLRYVTQAGGRLPADRVRRFAELGRARGWQLVVMYGATEATARMAYLPPDLAVTRPDTIGRAIPGGRFTIEPVEGWSEPGVGELVYHGPNVMMGYAERPADLARGPQLDRLHTGDIARQGADGLYEVIGRRNRFVKMYGLRIDLQRIEAALRDRGVAALCAADDADHLVIAATGADAADVQRLAAQAAGVPVGAVHAVTVPELPLLPSGKPDYQTVRTLSRAGEPGDAADVRAVYADALHLDPDTIDPDASFVDLGGNSLSYVTVSVRLERVLGRLPADWPRLPVRELQQMARPPATRRRHLAGVETSVVLRAVAIVLVVGSHAELFEWWGGAHILLGIAGYNFARFTLTPRPRGERMRHLLSAIGWIAVPAVVWVAIALVITDDYAPSNLLLAQKFLGPHDSMTAGRLWFIEVLVWILVALTLVLCWPAADRSERSRPFAFAVAFLALGLALRYDIVGLDLGRDAWFTVLTFWFFALGWAAAKATATWQRVALTVVLAVALYGYFLTVERTLIVLAGLLLLIWVPTIRVPAALTVTVGVVAEASLYTYLTHFQVYPLFTHPAAGVVAALIVGVLLTQGLTLVRRRAAGWGRAVARVSTARVGG